MEKCYLDSIKRHISFKFNNLRLESNLKSRQHPIEEILYALEHPNLAPGTYQYALITAKAIYNIDKEDRFKTWFKRKWREAENNYNKAISVLSEYRALYYLLTTMEKIIPILDNEKIPGKENDKSPDFRLETKNSENIYFEVFTPRIKDSVSKEISKFFDEYRTEDNKTITVKTIAYNPVYGEEDECNRAKIIKSRILSKKSYAGQVCPNAINILWIDLIAPIWNYSKSATKPFIVNNCKGETFIGTNGIWHAFYGNEGTKIIKDRTSLKYITKHDFINQSFKGYFYEDKCKWSGVILAFDDGIVFFQNPLAEYSITKDQIKYLSRIDGFDFSLSWINIDDNYLLNRVKNIKKELEYMYNLNEK